MTNPAFPPAACRPTTTEFVAAWQFVRGQALCFEQHNPATAVMPADSLAVCLPLRRVGDDSTLVVALLALHDEVMAWACNMFALPDSEICLNDMHDAGREACNVIAGCVAAACAASEVVQIGLPRTLTPQQYAELVDSGPARLCYAGTTRGATLDIRVVMTVIDQPGTTRIECSP